MIFHRFFYVYQVFLGLPDVQITSGHQRLDGRDRRCQGVDVSVRARATAGGVATEHQRGGTWHGEARKMVDFHGEKSPLVMSKYMENHYL